MVPQLVHDEAFRKDGVRGMLSANGFLLAWHEYQGHLVDRINKLTAGMASICSIGASLSPTSADISLRFCAFQLSHKRYRPCPSPSTRCRPPLQPRQHGLGQPPLLHHPLLRPSKNVNAPRIQDQRLVLLPRVTQRNLHRNRLRHVRPGLRLARPTQEQKSALDGERTLNPLDLSRWLASTRGAL